MKMKIKLKAVAEDATTGQFFAVISFRDLNNERREIMLPRAELDDRKALRKTLLNGGCYFSENTDRDDRALRKLAEGGTTARRWKFAARTGWDGTTNKQFVHPAGVLGVVSQANVLLKPPRGIADGHAKSVTILGSHQSWVEHVATPAAMSSRMVFGICAALAAPLLRMMHRNSFGISLHGPSKIGKSTMLVLAGSVIGFGAEEELLNFRATDVAFNELPASFNDMLLPINELGLLTGSAAERHQKVQSISYGLAEGRGKSYSKLAAIEPSARHLAWRCIGLANGEESSDEIAEAANRTRAVGAAIRWIDLPATRKGMKDIFDFAPDDIGDDRTQWVQRQCEALRTHCRLNHGVAFVHFIEKLTTEKSIVSDLKRLTNRFVRKVGQKDDGQAVAHLATSFAHIAAAGVLGVRFGTLPWTEKLVIKHVKRCYRDARRALRTEDDLLQEGLSVLDDCLKSKLLKMSGKRHFAKADWKSADGFLKKTSDGKQATIRGEAFKAWFKDQRQPPFVLRWLHAKNLLAAKRAQAGSSATSIGWAESQPLWPDQTRPRSIVISWRKGDFDDE